MPDPLNPRLFKCLQKAFGHVVVANVGESMISRVVPSYREEGRAELEISHPGEYYQVDCPHCHDTRHRLWINHMFGRKSAIPGYKHINLCICYNEDCFSDYSKRIDLLNELTEDPELLSNSKIVPGRTDVVDRVMELPGPMKLLHELPYDHPANRYLASRFYEPEKLGRFYGVGYCTNSIYGLARNRIIAPIYMDKKLRGWQARFVGELNWKSPDAPPKWWTGPGVQRSRVLYNFDNAVKYQTGVLVEGPGDVWATGPMSMAILGSSLTNDQLSLILSRFRTGSFVMMIDPDQKGKKTATKMEARLSGQFHKGLAVVWLPAGTDPGKLDRGYLHDYINREARAQGVSVSLKPR